ncbi:hypothetical protein [Saccharopolyspora pogona]|uniref:hypothetical protein n=1 Tax=Saccharopolyspora pogona TaxID=333966 RepID=UPI00168281B4|nr:hypothetical protein [Saccharopolyspora pogona]
MTQTWRRTVTAIAALLLLFGTLAFAFGMSYGLLSYGREARGTSTVVLAPGSGQQRPAAEIY